MLLLVLILVLIAFGLLVVALLSGSVLWAWVSVGVSVAAAAVLLIDWLQRRSAVRAGAEAAAAPVAEPQRMRSADPEPVTEVLPVIPRSVDAPGRAGEGAAGNRYDDPSDATKTVVMPVVQPSASAELPSSASHETTASSGDSSLSVTKSGSPATASTPSAGAAEDGPDDAAPTTVAPAAGGQGASAPPTEVVPSGGRDDADDESPTTLAPAAHEPEGAPATAEAPAAEEAPASVPETAAAGVDVASADASVEPGAVADEQEGSDTAAAAANGTAADAGAGSDAAQPVADEEAPEEQSEAAAAAVVAGLDTEVLVVDEQPRFHLSSCRALVGKATIPLPVREAVELGFTPCGWCSPVRTLAAGEPATR